MIAEIIDWQVCMSLDDIGELQNRYFDFDGFDIEFWETYALELQWLQEYWNCTDVEMISDKLQKFDS